MLLPGLPFPGLVGASVGGGGGSGASYTFQTGLSAASSNPSWSSVDIGSEPAGAETRHILLAIAVADLSGSGSISSVTVGGVAATRILRTTNSTSINNSEIWIAEVPSGTTATISVSSNNDRFTVGVYRVMNLSSASAKATATADSSSGTADLSVEDGDLVFAAFCSLTASSSYTLTNVTEDYDNSPGSFLTGAAGSATAASTETLAIGASIGGGASRKIAAVALA